MNFTDFGNDNNESKIWANPLVFAWFGYDGLYFIQYMNFLEVKNRITWNYFSKEFLENYYKSWFKSNDSSRRSNKNVNIDASLLKFLKARGMILNLWTMKG